ncbi:MAG TPA: Holliday junction branch migration protein RuvA [Candidatus Sulfotelmatobacter sp.]|nr:Holliday junction branch migration protein RuvA [Candidatus Sulfotelmatobacter sp.]
MIASLRGVLAEKAPGYCVVDAGGVGYLVSVSTFTASSLPPVGSTVALRTRQIVREDALMLFGFSESQELKLFDQLITVSGVGPKLAMAVLSGLRPEALARAIRDENLGMLVAIPGIGRRTAERMVVELRDRIEAPAGQREASVLPRAEKLRDAVAALTRLGYTSAQAEEALREVGGGSDEPSLEDLVRRALARLGKAAVGAR